MMSFFALHLSRFPLWRCCDPNIHINFDLKIIWMTIQRFVTIVTLVIRLSFCIIFDLLSIFFFFIRSPRWLPMKIFKIVMKLQLIFLFYFSLEEHRNQSDYGYAHAHVQCVQCPCIEIRSTIIMHFHKQHQLKWFSSLNWTNLDRLIVEAFYDFILLL